VVTALGGYGEYVGDPAQMQPALERAFASAQPACVNVSMQRHAAPALN
jgi:acetolactate synthase-1/2/3 large subunit